jgi:hypothetical protein
VFRTNWRDREFWAWWWQSTLSPKLRSAATVATCILIGAAGVFSADRLTSAKGSPSNVTVWNRTITHAVTERGRVVTVEVVRRVRRPHAERQARAALLTSVQVVTKPKVMTHTVVDTQTVTRSKTRVVTRTVTHSVTKITPPVTVTAPPLTVTQTLPAQTVTTTMTVTLPPGHGH